MQSLSTLQHTATAVPARRSMFTALILALCIMLVGAFGPATPARSQSLTTLHSFSDGSDGFGPHTSLIQAGDGNLYGATLSSLFMITTTGTLTILPESGICSALIQAKDGNFYGTTVYGGANYGTVFQRTPSGTLTTLYSFTGGSDGAYPYAGLVQASDGNLYGTTANGGVNAGLGYGTVFKITTSGMLTTLHAFTGGSDGDNPHAALIQAGDGNLYGTTEGSGVNGDYGTVFQMTPSGVLTTLHAFTGGSDGDGPVAALVQAGNGNLYGATPNSLFMITTTGNLTILPGFGSDGTLIQADDGNFYGTYEGIPFSSRYKSYGTVFQMTPSGTLTTLYSFTGGNDGKWPVAGLVQASDGNFYGTTYDGGAGGWGTVYRLSLTSPVLGSLSPTSCNAGSPALTLTLKVLAHCNFASNAVVDWTVGATTTALSTTHVSPIQLKATVPASLVASPGKAVITVKAPGVGVSNSKPFTIVLTTLNLTAATLSRDPTTGVYTATITLKNVGYIAAPNVTLKKATLGAAATTTALPANIGSLAAGASGGTSLSFPGSAGASGTVVALKVSGTFSGGTFTGTLKVTLP